MLTLFKNDLNCLFVDGLSENLLLGNNICVGFRNVRQKIIF